MGSHEEGPPTSPGTSSPANQMAVWARGSPTEISIIGGEEESACGGLSTKFRKQVEEEERGSCQHVRSGKVCRRRPGLGSTLTSSGPMGEQQKTGNGVQVDSTVKRVFLQFL